LAGSNDGRVTSFTTADGAQPVSGDSHGSQVVALATAGDKIYSAGFDDTIREIDVGTNKFSCVMLLESPGIVFAERTLLSARCPSVQTASLKA
jgi:hypothetical protein